ncbi:CDP-glycerol glycerophosphotransferase family protein [Lentibacillus sp. Marseille-P4043]|uniref:CDP-glycerol glycerophosphotransferase family protein n=1 Tax=Lentibacillus sp. Marseille-P4043 TaxID=2040293 RepID=UPI000D0B7EAB|nr:CDP-glycerol glycerophosphotransferase family protein [Lentibacillus sp. Marseille-P4043]
MEQLTNKEIQEIKLKDDTYSIKVSMKKVFIEGWDNYFFAIFQRDTSNVKTLVHRMVEETSEFYIFRIKISFGAYDAFFTAGDSFDLSIVRRREDEEKRSRIKSNFAPMDFLQIPVNESTIFYPATTKEGNVSFYRKENFLLAKFASADLTKGAILHLNGIYHFPGLDPSAIKHMALQLTTNLNDDVIQIPVSPQQAPAAYQTYAQSGFQAEIDMTPYVSLGRAQYFKFHLIMDVEKDGRVERIESTRIKVGDRSEKYTINRKLKFGNAKIQLMCFPTKKSKYFSLRVKEYKLPVEMFRTAREKWISLRRSKKLLKLYKMAFYILGTFMPVDKKLVMFESFHGKQYSDNPRAIFEYMKEAKPDYQLIWSADRRHLNNFNDKDVVYVRRFSVRWLLLMTRAKYWVTNARLPLWIPKPGHTTYLQTWHGTPLKRLAVDMEEVHMPGTNTEKYKQNFAKESSKWDYLVSPNAYSSKIFKRAFQFSQTMVESGYPRNDYLYNGNNPQMIHQLKQTMGIPDDKKVILYAPTWRDNNFYGKGRYKFDLELDLAALQEQFGDTHVIVLRKHYLVAENLDISAYKGFVYDFSKYDDIRDLYLISDLLITDYSSVFFDYANLRRPMMFFVYDIDDYRDNLRGFYFDFEQKAPGPLVKTTEEIIAEIAKLEENGFQPSANYDKFYERFCYLEDGNASKRVVDHVFK